MTVGTWAFSAFVLAVVVVHRLLPAGARPWLLLAASLAFYAGEFPLHAVIIAVLSVATWLLGRSLATAQRPRLLVGLGVAGWLIALGTYKYTGMLATTWNTLGGAGVPDLPVPELIAPLGLSYIAFGSIRYLAETLRGAPSVGLADYLLFTFFFPTVTSGPIKRYGDFVDDLRTRTLPGRDDIAYAVWRILTGLMKKLVIADTLMPLSNLILRPESGHPFLLYVSVLAFTARLYFDFSGYSDIAIGIGRLFGFRIMENFKAPYLKRNLVDFWRSWHISLTSFITEYVYIPLGGSRRGAVRTALNTLIAFGLSGLWHGAAWHFVAWGLWHGVGLLVVREWHRASKLLRSKIALSDAFARSRVGAALSYAFGWTVTFVFVSAGWVLFAVPMGSAWRVYVRMARFALATFGIG